MPPSPARARVHLQDTTNQIRQLQPDGCRRGSVGCASVAEQASSGASRRRRAPNQTRSATAKSTGQPVRTEPRHVAGFDVAGALRRGLPVDDLAKLKAQSRYLGSYAWEVGLDPHDLCPLCGEMFGGWCLHADHVMPEHFGALYRLDGGWRAVRDAQGVPEGAEVFHAVQCAAYAHAPCNLRKGRTSDVSAWRLAGLAPLIVAESDAAEAVAVPGPVIVAAEPRTLEQRAAEALGLQHAKTASGGVRGRRLSIEERNREAQLAQQALAVHQQRRVSHQRPMPAPSTAWIFSPTRRRQERARRRDDRNILCNFNGPHRPKLCVGNGPRQCWCAKVRPETADRLIAAFGADKALEVLVEDPPRPMQALAGIGVDGAKTTHSGSFQPSDLCTAGCTSEDSCCPACG